VTTDSGYCGEPAVKNAAGQPWRSLRAALKHQQQEHLSPAL